MVCVDPMTHCSPPFGLMMLAEGCVVSMRKGPRCWDGPGLPAPFTGLTWKYHEPSGKGGYVAAVPDVSGSASGSVVAESLHAYEYPTTPLPPPTGADR